MKIIKAKPEDFPRIRLFYHSVIDAIQDLEYLPGWKKDIYPAPDDLINEIADGCLYYGVVDDCSQGFEAEGGNEPKYGGGSCVPPAKRIAAAMVVNQKCHEEYQNAQWKIDASLGEFMAIHMLAVHPRYARRGLATQMVRFALDVAKSAGMKAMRLDVLIGNVPAEKLYPTLGFEYIETRPMFYEDVGTMDFELFERAL